MEKHQASKELQLFFNRLIEIKYFVKECADQSKDETLKDIYERLDTLIKTGDI